MIHVLHPPRIQLKINNAFLLQIHELNIVFTKHLQQLPFYNIRFTWATCKIFTWLDPLFLFIPTQYKSHNSHFLFFGRENKKICFYTKSPSSNQLHTYVSISRRHHHFLYLFLSKRNYYKNRWLQRCTLMYSTSPICYFLSLHNAV